MKNYKCSGQYQSDLKKFANLCYNKYVYSSVKYSTGKNLEKRKFIKINIKHDFGENFRFELFTEKWFFTGTEFDTPPIENDKKLRMMFDEICYNIFRLKNPKILRAQKYVENGFNLQNLKTHIKLNGETLKSFYANFIDKQTGVSYRSFNAMIYSRTPVRLDILEIAEKYTENSKL